MKTKRQAYIFIGVLMAFICAQIIISNRWHWIDEPFITVLEKRNTFYIKHYGDSTSLDGDTVKAPAERSFINITNIRKGKFRPSFSLGSKSVALSSIDRYNEFEYEDFRISEPKFPRSIDRELFYKLSSGTELLQPVPYIKKRGIVEVIPNGSFSSPFLCGWPSNYTSMYKKPSRSIHYDKLCPLLTPEGNTFQHFIDGLLPKLIQVRDILLHPDMKLLIANPRPQDRNMIMDILNRVGIKSSQIVWFSNSAYSANYMVAACITPPLHPVLWKTARRLLGVQDRLQISHAESSVILLTRAMSHNGGRILLNKIEVAQFLRNRYGKDRVVVFKGGYSLNESISIFGKANLIIGVHGGAFYNLNFAPKSAKLLEIMPYALNSYPQGLATTIFWSMASLIGQNYWRLFVETSGGNNNVILDIKLLNMTLEMMEK